MLSTGNLNRCKRKQGGKKDGEFGLKPNWIERELFWKRVIWKKWKSKGKNPRI